jgi:hypothetical protein
MKKLFLMMSLLAGSYFTAHASEFKLDDENIENMISSAAEYTAADLQSDISMISAEPNNGNSFAILKSGGKSESGYFIRWFFCGGIALHRYYMGAGDAKNYIWALYLCVPIASWVAWVGDLIYPLVDNGGIDNYANNSKWFVFFK